MQFQYKNEFVAFGIVLLFVLGLLIPIVVIGVSGFPSHQIIAKGKMIDGTPFIDISSNTQDNVMLPGGAAIPTASGVRMIVDYSNLERVNESTAIDSVLQFANTSSYLADQNLTIDTGWTRLESTYWTFRFFGSNAEVYASVNAFSGNVTEFHIAWQGPSPYIRDQDETDLMTDTQIEGQAIEFLENHNYSLNQYTMYLGPQVEFDIRYLSHYVYAIRFFNVINETLVWGNVAQIFMDIKTGEMVSFSYLWTFVSSINIQDSISSQQAEEIAMDYITSLEGEESASIISSALILKHIVSDPSAEYSLVWAVSVAGETIGTIFLDAISGEVLSVNESVLASPILQPAVPQITIITLVVVPPLVLGLAAFLIARRKVWISLPKTKTGSDR